MRVGFVTGEYPPMQGGVGAFTRELARAIAVKGHEVQVLTRAEVQNADEAGIAIQPIVGERWGWNTIGQIQAWIRDSKIELVNIQFQTAAFDMHPAIHWLPSCIEDVPVVVTFHDLRVPYLFPKAGSIRTRVVRKLARDANGVIATDRTDAAILTHQWSIPHVCWIPIGSNVSTSTAPDYSSKKWRAEHSIGTDDLVISYFGFLNESKGGMVLIEALEQLVKQGVPAQLVMIGGRAGSSDPTNFAYGERLDAMISAANLGERVHWTGFVDDSAVSAAFHASDITALPYLDGVSLRRGTLMAALTHGRAIVTTTPEMDMPELDGAVVTVPANDPTGLANSLLKLWRDPVQRAALEQGALAAASHFTWDQIAQQTLDYFQSIGR